MHVGHAPMTHPGKHAAAIDALPDDVETVLETVRGLFVHTGFLHLYGLSAADLPGLSRETLPVETRLDRVFAASDAPLTASRPYKNREAGTCRDYALMTCAILRRKSREARIRCGFATYFTPARFEDHWICEYRTADGRWARADAELDAEHRKHLGIDFDTSDMPDGAWLTAAEAWRRMRSGADPELFGHGDASGEWFLWVNLARDWLALNGQMTSGWDGWRAAIGNEPAFGPREEAICNDLATCIEALERGAIPKAEPDPRPFWLA